LPRRPGHRQDNQVRVFDVQHIKGLEFEAVFFVGLDRLAKREPDIFAKYLYVGATRAALFWFHDEAQLPPILRRCSRPACRPGRLRTVRFCQMDGEIMEITATQLTSGRSPSEEVIRIERSNAHELRNVQQERRTKSGKSLRN